MDFCCCVFILSSSLNLCVFQHPFVKNAKGVFILRDLINEAMDVKLKIQEAQHREMYHHHDEEENSVSIKTTYTIGPLVLAVF